MKFKRFIGIDWSGSQDIKSRKIAVAQCDSIRAAPELVFKNAISREDVYNWIIEQANLKDRILIGIDCNFGYNADIGRKHFGEDYTYQDQWRSVNETCQETLNFYAGEFWKNDTYNTDFWEIGKQPLWFNHQMLQRETESACVNNGLGLPESPFKIFGPKQVGKGGLAGMRMAHALKAELGDKIAFWPYENIKKATIVVTEIFPRLFWNLTQQRTQKVIDAIELNKALMSLNSFPFVGNDFTDDQSDAIVSAAGMRYLFKRHKKKIFETKNMSDDAIKREGWILGVPVE